jgi:hypothetical protein|eukprot:TRINITY_DN15602_c0_g1_i1.p1 TRINITY_DN15602_c0_g1~~TRINITY_DN15602_c0_g1_i1.p1  ORF type:complete len:355 (-),score=56.45 TRINITY_DN15602_c0_g1_i1:860-1924(-)
MFGSAMRATLRRFNAAVPTPSALNMASPQVLIHGQSPSQLLQEIQPTANNHIPTIDHLAELRKKAAYARAAEEMASLRRMAVEAKYERALLQEKVDTLSQEIVGLVSALKAEQVGFRDVNLVPGATHFGAMSRVPSRPTLETAASQPARVSELGTQSLAELAMHGNRCAHRERLIREIMCVDKVSWEEANEKMSELSKCNGRFYWIDMAPYLLGIFGAISAGVCGTAMVFSKPVAEFYATAVAGETLPESVVSIEEMTTNQVGAWTWTWMEPMIGTASFVLLCCQFARSSAVRMNMQTYTDIMMQRRSERLVRLYPEYKNSTVKAWARHPPRMMWNLKPVHDYTFGLRNPRSGL